MFGEVLYKKKKTQGKKNKKTMQLDEGQWILGVVDVVESYHMLTDNPH